MKPFAQKKPSSILRNEKGIALMLALFTFGLLAVLIAELTFDTTVEHQAVSQDLSRLQARYNAKAGVEFSLLRILLYKQAVAALGDSLPKEKQGLLNMLWSFPIPWPLSDFVNNNEEVSSFAKEEINSMEKNSLFKGNFNASITPEETKLDINDLGSPIEEVQKYTKKQILDIFIQKKDNDDDFSIRHSDTDFEDLVNNMIDWVDDDQESLNGGSESEKYRDYKDGDKLPPNQFFKTKDEIHRVAGMKDEFYQLLKDRITIYGAMGININHAPTEQIKAIDPEMRDETLAELLKRRSDPDLGPFSDLNQFEDYMNSIDPTSLSRIQELGVPLLFGKTFNFAVKSISQVGKITYSIDAVTFDFDNLKEKLVGSFEEQYNKENKNDEDDGKKEADNTQTKKEDEKNKEEEKEKVKAAPPKGRPLVVEWAESL